MVAVAEEVLRREAAGEPVGVLRSVDVALSGDGSVTLPPTPDEEGPVDDATASPAAGGATLGRLYFELLVGRRPLERADAHEPAITAALDPSVCALLARSIGDAPGQWPDPATWAETFAAVAGGLAPPPPPTQVRRERRRRWAALVALGILAAVTLAIVLAVPSWWEGTSEGSGPPTCASGARAGTVYCERARS